MQTNKQSKLEIYTSSTEDHTEIPYSKYGVSAGFPSPADDFIDLALDLNKELIKNRASTFFARVRGVSMIDDGINDGDLLIIDKSKEATNGCLAIAYIDGEFTLKRIKIEEECIWLVPANTKYKAIKITPNNDFTIWGIVTYIIKKI